MTGLKSIFQWETTALESLPEKIKPLLGKDLPFPLIVNPFREKGCHLVTEAFWMLDHGRQPYGHVPVRCELAFVTSEGRNAGYKSGIPDITVKYPFQGFGFGQILMRNLVDMFKACGETDILVLTENIGACVWQNMGFLAAKTSKDLNNEEDIFSDWESDNYYRSHQEQCVRLKEYLEYLVKWDRISAETAQNLIQKLDPDDPTSIWTFLDDKTLIAYEDHNRTMQERPLVQILMKGSRVHLGMNLTNNMQMNRLADVSQSLRVDREAFEACKDEYVRVIRKNYDYEYWYVAKEAKPEAA